MIHIKKYKLNKIHVLIFYCYCDKLSESSGGASLVAQWLRVSLLMQGTWVRALVWEDPTCHGASKAVSHNY